MCISYNDVLKRLIEERNRMALTQKDMSQRIQIDQSNYSKVELGLRRLGYYEVKNLYNVGVDVYYIYTGQKSSGRYEKFFLQCSNEELLCFLNVLYSIVQMYYQKEPIEKWEEILARLKYFSLKEKNQQFHNIFLLLRYSMGWQQKKIAEKLGVDIKKWRDLENERKLPDSELLSRLYERFYISPAIVFENKKDLESEITVSLEKMGLEVEQKILEVFTLLHKMNQFCD